MLEGSLETSPVTNCPRCGGPLDHGYLLGKHNRIRWSKSDKGMTIFHGVPLTRLSKGFWKTRRWWLYAPSIPAVKCRRCRLVTFAYDNEETEQPAREGWAAALIGVVMVTAAAAIVAFAFLLRALLPQLPSLAYAALAVMAVLLAGLGLIPLIHSFRTLRRTDPVSH